MRDASASYYLANPRLAAHALGLEPVWLWSEDGSRALWANAAGASLFSASTVGELTARRFVSADPEMQQVVRLAQTLANDGAPRLERLRVFGAGLLLQPMVCACSRLTIDDATAAILICGVDPIRSNLSLQERVGRLLEGDDGALAAFTLAGDLVFATPHALQLLGSANNLAAIEASALAAEAITAGQSEGSIPLGPVTLRRVGREAETLIIMRMNAPAELPQAAPGVTSAKPQEASAEFHETRLGHVESVAQAIALAKSTLTASQRRHPLRFVWEIDSEEHFRLTSDEFIALAGPATAQKNGTRWSEICSALGLDPHGQVASAIATHDTWSGIVISWPAGADNHIKVELSGLPIFDRQRRFIGYRGFGVCRDVTQLDRLAREHIREIALSPPESGKPIEPTVVSPETSRPALSLVPASANVVPFPAALPPAEQRAPGLSAGERKAFSDIAQQLSARLRASVRAESAEPIADEPPAIITPQSTAATGRHTAIDGRKSVASGTEPDGEDEIAWFADGSQARVLLECLPFGVLIYRANEMLFANRAFLDRVGFADLAQFSENGGLDTLQLVSDAGQPSRNGVQSLKLRPADSDQEPIEARLFSVPSGVASVNVLILADLQSGAQDQSATAQRASIRDNGLDRALDKIHAQQLEDFRHRLDQAAIAHTEFLKRINRDLRTPLTAILGFAETILSERFGPIGNERYRDYLGGIRNAGDRILALLDEFERNPEAAEAKTQDKIKTAETDVDLNSVVQACVAELQPDASRDRVLIRTSLHRPLPEITADANAVRQIVLNLLTNSIRLAGAGGQVIISTGVSGAGTVSLRLRDTGTGVNENDVAAALRPEPDLAARKDVSEGRLKLAVAKALLEANRASLKISSRPDEGTLVEVSFREVSPAA